MRKRTWLLLPLLAVLLGMMAIHPASSRAATEQALCAVPATPKIDGPKNVFGQPVFCTDGQPIQYKPETVSQQEALSVALNSADDLYEDGNRVFTTLYDTPLLVDGEWQWIGSIARFANGDIAYVASDDHIWGISYIKIVRPAGVDGHLVFNQVYLGEISGRHVGMIAVGDINGDSFEDIAVAASDDPGRPYVEIGHRGRMNVFWGKNAQNTDFGRVDFDAHNTPYTVALAPINGGRRTMGVLNWNSNMFQTFTPTDTQQLNRVDYPGRTSQAGWDDITVGDINSDGNADFVSMLGQASYNPYLRTFRGDGKGAFVEGPSVYAANRDEWDPPSTVLATDATRDGKDDIVMMMSGNYNPDWTEWGSRLYLYPQVPQDESDSTLAYTPTVLLADDVPNTADIAQITCGDNDPDLWVQSAGWHRSMYFIGLPEGGYDPVMRLEAHPADNRIYVNGADGKKVVLMDLNGDTLPDEVFSADYQGLRYRLHKPCANISISAPNQVTAGDSFTYTVSVTNTGLAVIENMEVKTQLPGLLTDIKLLDGGTLNELSIYTSPQFNLAAGESRSFRIKVTTTVPGGLVAEAQGCASGVCTDKVQAITNVVRLGTPPQPVVITKHWLPMVAGIQSHCVTLPHQITVRIGQDAPNGGEHINLKEFCVNTDVPVKVRLAGSSDGQASYSIDDQLWLNGQVVEDYSSEGCHILGEPQGPRWSRTLQPGTHSFQFAIVDDCTVRVGSSPLYLVADAP